MDISIIRKRAGWLVFLFCLAIYSLTLCPTVFWDDAGELIAAAYTLGIPHPPGHPLYVIIGKLFTLIPLGSIAARVNFMSAFFGAVACWLVYKIIWERLDEHPWRPAAAAGGALFFAFATTVWEQSTVAETTTLHCSFMMLLTLFTFRLASGGVLWKDEGRSLCLLAFLFGVSLTNHVAGVFFFPAISCVLIWKFRGRVFRPKLFFGMFASLLMGLLTYAYLPLRSMMDPAIDWGNPETLRNFIWVVTARQYAPDLVSTPNIFLVAGNLFLRGRDLLHQFSLLGCFFGAVGVWRLAKQETRVVIYSFLAIAALFYTGLNSAFISAYFVPAFALISIWIGVGLFQVFEWMPRLMVRIRVGSWAAAVQSSLCAILAAGFLLPLSIHYREMDRSKHDYALLYGRRLLEGLPQNSAFFTTDGYALFILWYLIHCEHERPDVMVIDPTWLAGSIALSSQVLEQYRELKVPSPEMVARYTAKAKGPADRRFRTIQAFLDVNYRDRPIYWGIIEAENPFVQHLVPEGVRFRYSASPVVLDDTMLAKNTRFWESEAGRFHNDGEMQKDKISKEIYPVELNNQGLMFEKLGHLDLSRMAIEQALEFNPEYPISRYNLGRLEALEGNHQAAAREYRLATEGNPYMAVAYYGLGNANRNIGKYDEAFLAYRQAVRLYPEYFEAITGMGRLYGGIGHYEEAADQYNRALEVEPSYVFALRGLAEAYLQLGRPTEAKSVLDKALELEPDSVPGLFTLARYYARVGEQQKAAGALSRSIALGGNDRLKEALNDDDLNTVAKGLMEKKIGA
jgi:tetratricopeptide (TPR) repeat protein